MEYMRYLSIRVKLVILTLITLIPLIILESVNIRGDFQSNSEQKLQSGVELAHAISASFYNSIEELWTDEFIIGNYIAYRDNDVEEIQSYINTIANTKEINIERLSWVSPDGTILANTRKYMIGQSLVKRDYYKRIVAGEDKVVSDLVESYVDGAIVVPVARAIRENGKLLGIIIYAVDVNKLVSNIPDPNLHKGDVLTLIDRNGRIAYQSMNNKLSFKERLIQRDAPERQALRGEIVKTYKSKLKINGSYRMGVDYPIKEIGWVCSVSSDRNIVLKDTYRQAVKSVVTLTLISIMALVAAYVFGKRIAEPLVILKNKAEEFKQGNYYERANINGYDEVAATAQAFDLMADSIEEYDKLKGQFFSNISHEFKTPINVIYSCIQLIESFQDTLDYKQFKSKTIKNIKVIRQNCYRLMRLINNMIDVTRYDTGNFRLVPSKLNIVSIIEEISLSVVKHAEDMGVTIIFDTEVEEKEICCDPEKIERILLNLISNSLKFTDAGGFIYINVYDRGDKVAFSVRDTGIGMPKDKISIIFDRFRQLDASLNRNHEGSGLGLSIVKALVEAHKGNITVNSELGVGTEFVVELPADVLCNEIKENDITLFESQSDTIQKIEVEFSDIYN